MNKALFLDRDGVIIDYIPYLSQPQQISIPQGADVALRMWQAQGYLLIMITNQSGIGRGYFTFQDVKNVHTCLLKQYQDLGVHFTDIYLCPHHPAEQCICRKPSPYMVQQACQKYGIEICHSFFFGDAPSDIECAVKSGCQPVLILTGRGHETAEIMSEQLIFHQIPIFPNLLSTTRLLQDSESISCNNSLE